ncbi:MAG: sigma-54 dependent transcriptional regulator [Fibrobacterota bacterium]
MYTEIPAEIRNNFFLHYFTQVRFISILYDEAGNPIWAINRNEHKYREIIETLMSGPVDRFFELPVKGSLKQLFSNAREKNPAVYEKPVSIEMPWGAMHFPLFPAQRFFGIESVIPNFVLDKPLFSMTFVPIANDRYLGIMSFPDILTKLSVENNKPALFVDDKNHIFAYNAPLFHTLGLSAPVDLLGQDIFQVLDFNYHPLELTEDDALFTSGARYQWQAGDEAQPFTAAQEHGRITKDNRGLHFENNSPDQAAFFKWETPLPIDKNHFSIQLDYESPTLPVPRLVLRGNEVQGFFFPDNHGYLFTPEPEGGVQWKKSGDYVALLPLPDIDPLLSHRLEIRKVFNRHTFFLDTRPLGQWHETSPFIYAAEDHFYLFLAPGESLTLHGLSVRTVPFNSPASPKRPLQLTARYVRSGRDVQFNVSFQQNFVYPLRLNYIMYQFDDVTELRRDINHLQQERNKLATILRNESAFIGQSKGIQAIRTDLATVSASGLSVLIEGETGSGKEVLALAVHDESPRKDKPFVKIDCSTIPEELMESELFGHERGSFTGAVASHTGRFEQAQGGTVFLDEVANLSLRIQAKLLNVFQDRRIQPVGSTKTVPLDIRIVAASNVSLRELIETHRFRKDLYYRLNQVRFVLPPLRERREDIPALVDYFIRQADQTYKKAVTHINAEAMKKLFHAEFPGNVRELRNIILRAVLFCKSDTIAPEDVEIEEFEGGKTPEKSTPQHEEEPTGKTAGVTPEAFAEALAVAGGNLSKVARHFSVSRVTAYKLAKSFRMDLTDFRQNPGATGFKSPHPLQ